MQRRRFVTTGAIAAASLATVAASPVTWAQTTTQPGTPLPPAHVAESVPNALFAGTARMRFLAFDVYDASLWVAPGFQASLYGQSPLILELGYLRNLNGRSIAQRSLSEMRRVGSVTPEQEQRWQTAMEASFPDVKAGDHITGVHSPVLGARFWFNGLARPPIRDPEFSRLFFGIWLSPATSEPKLRAALLSNLSQ